MVESIEHTYVVYVEADSRDDAEEKAYEDESVGIENNQVYQNTAHYNITNVEEME